MFSGGYMLISLVFAAIGFFVQQKLLSKMKFYGARLFSRGMTGKDVAEAMLRYNQIYDVQVVSGEGMLSDHYNPSTKTVNLSPDVYSGNSVMAAAVAAHECGHAVQHKESYAMLQLRSKIVPAVQVASFGLQLMMLLSFMMANRFPQLMLITIGLFAVTTLFSVITLPVEFDASRRALAWLGDQQVLRNGEEYDGAKDALTWAAMTYVVAALSSIVMLVYLILQYMGLRRSND